MGASRDEALTLLVNPSKCHYITIDARCGRFRDWFEEKGLMLPTRVELKP